MAAFDVVKNEEPDLRSEQECFPEVDPGIDVAGDRVLVQLRREKVTSKGGIILVDETRQTIKFNETVAKVIQVGPLAYKDEAKFPTGPWCKEGDWIIFGRYAGARMAIDGGEIRILNDDEILATIKDPEDILHM